MAKGFIRKFAAVGLGLACAFVMVTSVSGCCMNKCHKCKNCDKPCKKMDTNKDKG